MIHTCFSPAYYADTPTASMRKLPVVARMVEERGLAKLHDPGSIDPDLLRKLHDPGYVDDFLNGEGLCSTQGWPWTPEIRDGVLAINAGQIKGTELALEHGIAANIAQGFHHSCYDSGQGYCTFNGLALVAQQFPSLRVGVLDCDEHWGNGTDEFTERLPNLYNYSIFGRNGVRAVRNPHSISHSVPKCTHRFKDYLSAVASGLDEMVDWSVDLLIYQAGADPHIDDPYGSIGLTAEQLRLRDRYVFQFVKKSNLKTLFVLAGGYQVPIETKLAPLHVATFEEACKSRA